MAGASYSITGCLLSRALITTIKRRWPGGKTRTASHLGEFGSRKAAGLRQGGLSRMLFSVPTVLELQCLASGVVFLFIFFLLNGNYGKTT